MEPKNESIRPPENINTSLNPSLEKVLNAGLNITYAKFYKDNDSKKDDPQIEKFFQILDLLSESIDGEHNYIIREKNPDQEHGVLRINLLPKEKINFNILTKKGSPAPNLDNGPVDECQLNISPFFKRQDSKAKLPDGFSIDFSSRQYSWDKSKAIPKFMISDKLISLGMNIFFDGKCEAF